jgi:hypothetical protein
MNLGPGGKDQRLMKDTIMTEGCVGTNEVMRPYNPASDAEVDKMKMRELKECLRVRGQKVSGNKQTLVDRLKQFHSHLPPGPAPAPTPLRVGDTQKMIIQAGDIEFRTGLPFTEDLFGKPKGMEQVLRERGLWIQGMKGNQMDPLMDPQAVLAKCPDFVNQKTCLELLGDRIGVEIIHLSKFHAECNPIELHWGWAKEDIRKHTDGKMAYLRKHVLPFLQNMCPLRRRQYFRKAREYMLANHLCHEETHRATAAHELRGELREKRRAHSKPKRRDVTLT